MPLLLPACQKSALPSWPLFAVSLRGPLAHPVDSWLFQLRHISLDVHNSFDALQESVCQFIWNVCYDGVWWEFFGKEARRTWVTKNKRAFWTHMEKVFDCWLLSIIIVHDVNSSFVEPSLKFSWRVWARDDFWGCVSWLRSHGNFNWLFLPPIHFWNHHATTRACLWSVFIRLGIQKLFESRNES